MTVTFVVDYPWDQRDWQRFGVETLRAKGMQVSVLDLTEAARPGLEDKLPPLDRPETTGYHRCTSWRQADEALGRLTPGSFVICMVGYNYWNLPLYRSLRRRRLQCAVLATMSIPPTRHRWLGAGSRSARLRRLPRRLAGLAWRCIPIGVLGVRHVDLIIAGGRESPSRITRDYPVGKRSRVLWTHCLDYDVYLRCRRDNVSGDPAVGVFLDQTLPSHPDFLAANEDRSMISADHYYGLLRGFFDRIERDHHVRIVIAAHPRSQYGEQPPQFGGRPTTRGQTADLVRDASFVIAHDTTAVNFAVLFQKAVVFLNTDAHEANPGFLGDVASLATRLGKVPVNLDHPRTLDWREEMRVDLQAYQRFREDYIKRAGTPQAPVWHIVADHLEALGNA